MLASAEHAAVGSANEHDFENVHFQPQIGRESLYVCGAVLAGRLVARDVGVDVERLVAVALAPVVDLDCSCLLVPVFFQFFVSVPLWLRSE
jgi:hypothetical protein